MKYIQLKAGELEPGMTVKGPIVDLQVIHVMEVENCLVEVELGRDKTFLYEAICPYDQMVEVLYDSVEAFKAFEEIREKYHKAFVVLAKYQNYEELEKELEKRGVDPEETNDLWLRSFDLRHRKEEA